MLTFLQLPRVDLPLLTPLIARRQLISIPPVEWQRAPPQRVHWSVRHPLQAATRSLTSKKPAVPSALFARESWIGSGFKPGKIRISIMIRLWRTLRNTLEDGKFASAFKPPLSRDDNVDQVRHGQQGQTQRWRPVVAVPHCPLSCLIRSDSQAYQAYLRPDR
jgi:hypothetical protein